MFLSITRADGTVLNLDDVVSVGAYQPDIDHRRRAERIAAADLVANVANVFRAASPLGDDGRPNQEVKHGETGVLQQADIDPDGVASGDKQRSAGR